MPSSIDEDDDPLLTSPQQHLALALHHLKQAVATTFSGHRVVPRGAAPAPATATAAAANGHARPNSTSGKPPGSEADGGGAQTTAQLLAKIEESRQPRQCCIIDPSDNWKGQWDIMIMMLILYSAVTVPVHIGFNASSSGLLWDFEASMSLVFMIDLILTFRTAYLENSVWVRDPMKIASRYLSGWFWIDGPSSIPVEIIEALMPADSSDTGGLGLLRFLRMFRLVRLLRLLKIDKYMSRLEEMLDVNLRALRVVGLVLKMTFIAHLLACSFFYVGYNEDPDVITWVSTYDDGAAMHEGLGTAYLFSIYWALTTLTTVGYGDITPTNDEERRFVTGALLFGALVFAYILGDIGSLLQTLDRQTLMVGERMDAVKEYLVWRGIPRDLGIRVRRYYEHFYTQRAVFDETSILGDLNPQLHSEMVACLLSGTIGKLAIFSHIEPELRFAIFPFLKPVSFAPNEVVFCKGDASKDLLFLLSGEVDVLSAVDGVTPCRRITTESEQMLHREKSGELAVQVTLPASGCFGQSVLMGRRRPFTHVAHTYCETLILAKSDLEALWVSHSQMARRACRLILKDQWGRDLLNSMCKGLRIAYTPRGEERAALVIQMAWSRRCHREAKRTDQLYQMIISPETAGDTREILVAVLHRIESLEASIKGSAGASKSSSRKSSDPPPSANAPSFASAPKAKATDLTPSSKAKAPAPSSARSW